MRDLLPGEMALYRRVEEAFARVCASWGYSEIRTPTIEYLHLFSAAGTLSPQMLGRVYSFLDWDGWSGERVVLRPDATIPAVRLYVENVRSGEPARFFYVQNVFRFSTGEESREDWQCGVELIGNPSPTGDIELMLLGREALRSIGFQDVEVTLSHAGLVRAVLAQTGLDPQAQMSLYDKLLDGDLSVLREIERRLPELHAPLHLLFDVKGGSGTYLENLRSAFAEAVPGAAQPLNELTTVSETLDRLGCPHEVQTVLVRNFEYYTGPVFEFRAAGCRLGGGGRYDGLIALVGGESVPASGFALSLSEGVSHLNRGQCGEPERERWLVEPADESVITLSEAFAVAERLRSEGFAVALGGKEQDGGYRVRLRIESKGDGFAYRLLDVSSDKTTLHDSLDSAIAASRDK